VRERRQGFARSPKQADVLISLAQSAELFHAPDGRGFANVNINAHTDQDEVLFDATRPVILNGIEDIVTRPDLADRALFLTLDPIPEERRRPEAELWAAFEAERPRILGVLLDAVVKGLNRLSETRLPRLPRMADFALWATACETALWPAGTFWSAYCGNRDEAVEGVIDADPVATAVRTVMATQTTWTGTASELLDALVKVVGERVAKSKSWPDSPRALAGKLRRAATFLRKVGIEVRFDREGKARTRIIRLSPTSSSRAAEQAGARPSAPSAPETPLFFNGLPADGGRTMGGTADGQELDPAGTVRAKALKSNGRDGADGADAKITPCSDTSESNGAGWSVPAIRCCRLGPSPRVMLGYTVRAGGHGIARGRPRPSRRLEQWGFRHDYRTIPHLGKRGNASRCGYGQPRQQVS
jgi:hypothetical protein